MYNVQWCSCVQVYRLIKSQLETNRHCVVVCRLPYIHYISETLHEKNFLQHDNHTTKFHNFLPVVKLNMSFCDHIPLSVGFPVCLKQRST